MKKIFSFLMAASLSLALFSCQKDNNPSNDGSLKDDEEILVEMRTVVPLLVVPSM